MFKADRLDDILAKLKPVIGEKKADALWHIYHTDSDQKDLVESLSFLLSAKHLGETYESKHILLPPVPAVDAKGEYPLGMVCYGDSPKHPFGLREEEWIHHVAIFGRSGSGKTTIAYLILANLLRRRKPFLVFDWKRNYRDLLSIYPDILVFTIGRDASGLSWNPLIPPEGVSPTVWIRKIIEILCHAYFLGEGVTYLLLKAIDTVFREHGIYEENPKTYPTFRDVFAWIKNYKATGREAQWHDSTKRTLAVLCFGEFGRALNVKKSANFSDLLQKNVVMELDALSNSDKTFFIEALLLWIHHYRMGQSERETFKHAILIEEAHHILLRKKQELSGEETITDVILREIRELGESIILIDQHPSLISKPALGNTYTTITMNLKHGADIATLADSILLEHNQREFLGRLPIGSGIVKLQGRWFKPFLVRFPYFPLKKGFVTDNDVTEKMKGYQDLFGGIEQGDAILEDIRVIQSTEKGGKKGADKVGKEEMALLQDAIDYPFSGIVERYKRLGLNTYQGNKIKNRLLTMGLLTESNVNTKTGRVKVLQPTPAALKITGQRPANTKTGHGKPSLEHEFWKNRIAENFRRQGYEVEIEKPLGDGKAVDIAAKKGEERIAIEIETGKSEALHNIRKDLAAGFEKVLSVALTNEVKQKTVKDLGLAEIENTGRLRVLTLDELLSVLT